MRLLGDGGLAPTVRQRRRHDELEARCAALYPKLVGSLTLHLGDQRLAEDLTQETFVRLYAKWSTIPPERVAAWCYKVAFNLAASWFRRRAAERRAYSRHGGHGKVWVDAETADVIAVRAAIGSLPDRPRTAIILRYYAELSIEEIGRTMNCPPGTVKSYLHRGIAALRASGLVDPAEVLARA